MSAARIDPRLVARLEDLALELDAEAAAALADDLDRAGLTLAAVAVKAGQRTRAQILRDVACELLVGHRR